MIYDHKYLHVITNLVDNVCILVGLSFQFNIPTWQFDKILSVRYSHLLFLLRAVLFVENIYRYAYVWVCVSYSEENGANSAASDNIKQIRVFSGRFWYCIHTSFSTQYFGNDIICLFMDIYTIFRHKVTQLAQCVYQRVLYRYIDQCLEKYICKKRAKYENGQKWFEWQ